MSSVLRVFVLLAVFAASALRAGEPPGVQSLDLNVDGTERHALVYVPKIAPGKAVPVVFVFHGHGSNAARMVEEFGINRRWPEAISIYPQGLPIPSITDPEGRREGWQHNVGEVGDRDLHFFDALLGKLKKDYPVDPKRIYATGHSNGGGFTYLLWLARGEVLAAVAPCSAVPKFTAQLSPKPVLIGAGKQDPIVKFEHQEAQAVTLRKINGCEDKGEAREGGLTTFYPSKNGTPLVTFFYEGAHALDPKEPDLIVSFFHQHLAR